MTAQEGQDVSHKVREIDGRQGITRTEGTPVGRDSKDAQQPRKERDVSAGLAALLDARTQELELALELLRACAGVHLAEDDPGGVHVAVPEEDPRALGQPVERAEREDRGRGAEADHVPPALSDMRKGGANGVGDDLAERDGDNVDSDASAAEDGRRELANVERGDARGNLSSESEEGTSSATAQQQRILA